MTRTQRRGLLALVLALMGSAPAAVFNVNLIRNAGAEDGAGGNGIDSIPVPEWDAMGSRATSVSYFVQDGFPELGDPGPRDRGVSFFAGGCCSTPTQLRQWIDLASAASEIDQADVVAALSGWLGGYDRQNDHVTLTVTWLGSSSNQLGTLAVGPVLAVVRNFQTGMLLRSVTNSVPSGTRSAWVDLDFVRVTGSYNDGYADELSLVLRAPVPADCGRLAVERAGDLVVVSWPAGTPCLLEASLVVPAPAPWTLLGDIQTVGDRNYHTNWTGLAARFYRLRSAP